MLTNKDTSNKDNSQVAHARRVTDSMNRATTVQDADQLLPEIYGFLMQSHVRGCATGIAQWLIDNLKNYSSMDMIRNEILTAFDDTAHMPGTVSAEVNGKLVLAAFPIDDDPPPRSATPCSGPRIPRNIFNATSIAALEAEDMDPADYFGECIACLEASVDSPEPKKGVPLARSRALAQLFQALLE